MIRIKRGIFRGGLIYTASNRKGHKIEDVLTGKRQNRDGALYLEKKLDMSGYLFSRLMSPILIDEFGLDNKDAVLYASIIFTAMLVMMFFGIELSKRMVDK